MPCREFEDLLASYAELAPDERQRTDTHLRGCAECRAWFDALAQIDEALAARFEGVHAPPTLAAAIRRQITPPLPKRVSAVPEILDFVGWLGVIGAASMVARFSLPEPFTLSTTALWTAAGVLLCLALSVTLWALRGSEG